MNGRGSAQTKAPPPDLRTRTKRPQVPAIVIAARIESSREAVAVLERVRQLTNEAADAMKVRRPEILVAGSDPAAGWRLDHLSSVLVFSRRAVDILDDSSVRALAAHELDHIAHNDVATRARYGAQLIATALATTVGIVVGAAGFGGFTGLLTVSPLILAGPAAAGRLKTRFLQKQELRADKASALVKNGPQALIRALALLSDPNDHAATQSRLRRSLLAIFGTRSHPLDEVRKQHLALLVKPIAVVIAQAPVAEQDLDSRRLLDNANQTFSRSVPPSAPRFASPGPPKTQPEKQPDRGLDF